MLNLHIVTAGKISESLCIAVILVLVAIAR